MLFSNTLPVVVKKEQVEDELKFQLLSEIALLSCALFRNRCNHKTEVITQFKGPVDFRNCLCISVPYVNTM